MTSSNIAKVNSQHSRFSRGLALVMLVLVLYGTTIEAAHKHGSILGIGDPVTSTSVSNASNTNVNANLTLCGDCLICQLHQYFSATVLNARLPSTSLSLHSDFWEATPLSFYSQLGDTHCGRAPPSTL